MPSVLLRDCVIPLQEAWVVVKAAYEMEFPERQLVLTATHRTPEEQFHLFQVGRVETAKGWVVDKDPTTRVLTGFDGATTLSKHNVRPSKALDFCVVIGGKVSWHFPDYEVVGSMGESQGLIWGGRWPKLRDGPHFELP